MTNVLIIAANRSAKELTTMIEHLENGFTICGTASTVAEAQDFLNTDHYCDLIVADTELSDGLSFEVFDKTSQVIPVIYCSQDHQYALQAFQCNGIDYLIRPLEKPKLQKSLSKFNQLKELFSDEIAPPTKSTTPYYTGSSTYKSSILAYVKDQIIPVSLEQTDYIYYNNYLVSVHTANGRFETRDTLNNLITSLNPKDFFRANRQFIINRKAVKSIQQYFGRKLLIGINTPTPEPVIISKANATDFLKWVEGLNYQNTIPLLAKKIRINN